MHQADAPPVLDRRQLEDAALADAALMRELLDTLVEDTGRQMLLLDTAIRERDPERCRRLAHYAKGACVNVGANAAAAVLRRLELEARCEAFDRCSVSLTALHVELKRLQAAAGTL